MSKPNYFLSGMSGVLLLVGSTLAAEKDVISKSFDVKPGGKLVMNVDRGSIRVNAAGTDRVDVKVVRELRSGSSGTARDLFEKHEVKMSQDGSDVNISASKPDGISNFFGGNPFNKMNVEYTVTVPKDYNLDLRTAGGNVKVSDIHGKVQAHTSGGHMDLAAIDGEIAAETSGGNIEVRSGKGACSVRTSGGHIKVKEIDGELSARTSGGNIEIDQVKGSLNAQTSGGHVKVQEVHGPINARTSGGNVSARLAKSPEGDCSLKTSGGNISLTVPAGAAMQLLAHTSGGNVDSDFPGELNKQRSKFNATVNGGGSKVSLETSGGNIDIHKQ